MSRPSLEVADIFRGHGPAWRRANSGHVSLGQLKVMSAIESCRTAALGGHVARCENETCAHTIIAYNSCRNRHCPKCQGAAAKDWLAAREADLLPVPYYHVVFTLPAAIADVAYQNKAVIYDLLFKASAETHHDRGRPKTPRRPRRHHLGSPYLGFGHDPSSARPHDRAGRRHLARRQALGGVPARLLPAGARALAPVSPAVPGEDSCHTPGRPPEVLRQSRRPRRRAGVRGLSGTATPNRMDRLRQAPVRGATGRFGLSVALHPPRRHRQQPADRLRPLRRDLPMEGLSRR